MTNEEFQKLVLEQLSGLRNDLVDIKQRQINMEIDQKNMKIDQKNMEARQDEIFQVVKAIEHSNQVGKAELDKHEFRIAKMEGKFKKVGKIFDNDEIESVSNL